MSRFINNLKRRVAKEQKKIVLPESESRRVLQAAERVQAEGFARPILIGRPQSIVEVASEYQIDMDGIEIIDPETYPMMDKFCQYYAKRRAKKGMSWKKPGSPVRKLHLLCSLSGCLRYCRRHGRRCGGHVIGSHPGGSAGHRSSSRPVDGQQFFHHDYR